MLGACIECDRLWREYSDATRIYLKIVLDQQAAAIDQNQEALAGLDSLHREAGERRGNARKALNDHKALQHGPGASG